MINTILNHRYFRFILFSISVLAIIVTLGRHLLPTAPEMFVAHDITQGGRIQEFTFNLQNWKVPPRIAPHFSFGLGYPVFNYYSPFAYWVSSFIHLIGFDIIASIKLSFALALSIGYISMFFLLRKFFNFFSSITGAVAYASSPYVAVDIFVRGNLSELWFFALFPLALYFVFTVTRRRFFLTALVLSFLFTVHNVFSLIAVPLILIFALLQENKKQSFLAAITGVLLGAYFLIPSLVELSYVYASEIATRTEYQDHFICLRQLLNSPWGYGGSTAGCISDGMSFKLGKLQILSGLAGMLLFLAKFKDEQKLKLLASAIFIISLGGLFLTSSFSKIIWELFEPVLALFQFPWRFILLILFGIAFFSGYFFDRLGFVGKIISIGFIIVLLFVNYKYFQGNTIPASEYHSQYLSDEYIHQSIAYAIPEYLPRTADFSYWQGLQKSESLSGINESLQQKHVTVETIADRPFYKKFEFSQANTVTIPVHYAPYWRIRLDGSPVRPSNFDMLGRPILEIQNQDVSHVTVAYRQTSIEILSNILSMVTFSIALLTLAPQLWKYIPIHMK